MLDLNITLLFQLVNFFIALFLLNVLLIKPIRAVLKKRAQIVTDMTGEAEGFESKAEQSLSDYEKALQKARQDAGIARQQGREDGVAEQQAMITSAQNQAHSILDDARRALQKEADATLATLRAQTETLSKMLADRLIKG
ncbi:MAG: ATP synthase F0 subunit B [Desulfovibrio sp.]|nr:ATP synthase F0 subunit B [Desulfovibrio sp.]